MINPQAKQSEVWNFKSGIRALIVALGIILLVASSGCTVGSGMSRGSDEVLQSVAGQLRYSNADLGKSVHLRMRQEFLVSLSPIPGHDGKWSVEGIDRQKFLLLTRLVRGESGFNSVWLYETRAYGFFSFQLVYTPYDPNDEKREYRVPVSISKVE